MLWKMADKHRFVLYLPLLCYLSLINIHKDCLSVYIWTSHSVNVFTLS